MHVPNFAQFGEHQFLGPNLSKEHIRVNILGQTQSGNNLFK